MLGLPRPNNKCTCKILVNTSSMLGLPRPNNIHAKYKLTPALYQGYLDLTIYMLNIS